MPIDVTCASCGTPYTLRDDLAGKKVRCRECQNVIEIPADPYSVVRLGEADITAGATPHVFAHDRYLLKQKRFAISEKYQLFDDRNRPLLYIERPRHFLRGCLATFAAAIVLIAGVALSLVSFASIGGNGNEPNPVMVVLTLLALVLVVVLTVITGVMLSPKRHIRFYADESKTQLVLEVLQDAKFNFPRANYTVVDPVDGPIGRFQKNYLYNFFRKRWYGLRLDRSVFLIAKEDSLVLSLLRRFLGSIEFLSLLLTTNFIFQRPGSEDTIGEFNRRVTLFDQYVLDLTGDYDRVIDRRLAVALGVLLDTGERR